MLAAALFSREFKILIIQLFFFFLIPFLLLSVSLSLSSYFDNTMAEALPETPTPTAIEQIALQIKSMEQRTTSVTLPRNASVLDLKQEVQVAFDVDSNRQRLIFQGRVLKDDKNLTDYGRHHSR